MNGVIFWYVLALQRLFYLLLRISSPAPICCVCFVSFYFFFSFFIIIIIIFVNYATFWLWGKFINTWNKAVELFLGP